MTVLDSPHSGDKLPQGEILATRSGEEFRNSASEEPVLQNRQLNVIVRLRHE